MGDHGCLYQDENMQEGKRHSAWKVDGTVTRCVVSCVSACETPHVLRCLSRHARSPLIPNISFSAFSERAGAISNNFVISTSGYWTLIFDIWLLDIDYIVDSSWLLSSIAMIRQFDSGCCTTCLSAWQPWILLSTQDGLGVHPLCTLPRRGSKVRFLQEQYSDSSQDMSCLPQRSKNVADDGVEGKTWSASERSSP